MEWMIPIGAILIFFALTIIINKNNLGVKHFEDYAVASRSFGFIGITFGIIATWYVGASFTAWAGFMVGFGFIGIYVVPYAAVMLTSMYMSSERSFIWGKRYNLETQADLLGKRYDSKSIRVLASVAGVVFSAPWLLMEWVTQGYIFSYASGGKISPFWGMLVGVIVVLIFVSLGGMKTVITGNILQGALMFFAGNGLMLWFIWHYWGGFGNAFEQLLTKFPDVLTYPGAGFEAPSPYWTSIVISSGLGAFMWPWVYNKLFAADSVRSIKRSALLAPILGAIFWIVLTLLGNFMHLFEYARLNPEEAYIWLAAETGIWPLALMSVLIMAASVSTVSGIIQSMSTTISRDIAQVMNRDISSEKAVSIARWSVVVISILALIAASVDLGLLIFIALLTYQGIIMLFPVIMLGLYWRRANKEGAMLGLIAGTVISMTLSVINPSFIANSGWSAGFYGLFVTTLIIVVAGFVKEPTPYVNNLFEEIKEAKKRARKLKSQSSSVNLAANSK